MADLRQTTAFSPLAASAQQGFTLAELLAALAILLIGITALIGALSNSVGERRTTEARLRAVAICDEALQRVRDEMTRRKAGAETDLELEIAPIEDQTVPGFPGMTWSATTVVDETRPDIWLVKLDVRWLEEGEDAHQEFLRVLPRCLPMAARVRRFLDETNQTISR